MTPKRKREIRAKYVLKQKRLGSCVTCGKKAANKNYCDKHRLLRNKKNAKYRAACRKIKGKLSDIIKGGFYPSIICYDRQQFIAQKKCFNEIAQEIYDYIKKV